MGLRVARDAMAVARLINSIDKDNTGGIDEDAFISYFWQLKKADLEEHLKTWQGDATASVELVTYDPAVTTILGKKQKYIPDDKFTGCDSGKGAGGGVRREGARASFWCSQTVGFTGITAERGRHILLAFWGEL